MTGVEYRQIHTIAASAELAQAEACLTLESVVVALSPEGVPVGVLTRQALDLHRERLAATPLSFPFGAGFGSPDAVLARLHSPTVADAMERNIYVVDAGRSLRGDGHQVVMEAGQPVKVVLATP